MNTNDPSLPKFIQKRETVWRIYRDMDAATRGAIARELVAELASALKNQPSVHEPANTFFQLLEKASRNANP